MPALIYGLCALVALICTGLLVRAWRTSRYRLLLWAALCFAALTANNVLLFLDKIVFTELDFSLLRAITALVAMSVLLYGLIWDAE
jgi:uncharacterized protein DUF5985